MEEIRRMSAIEQLEVVYEYFALQQRRFGQLNSLTDLYMATLWPAAIGQPDDFVLWERGSRFYRQNAGLDRDGDGRITVGETMQSVYNRRDTFERKQD
jgi:hypothetical protein